MHFHFHRHGAGGSSEQAAPSLPAASEPSGELRFLAPSELQFRCDGGRLQIREEGQDDWHEASLVRLFPLSKPEKWISVLDKDGREIGIILDLSGLDGENLNLAKAELGRRYLVPQISRILSCRDRFDLVEWTVETDRGRISFMTRNVREQMRQPLPERMTLTDVEGCRYDVPDVEALDPASHRLLEERL